VIPKKIKENFVRDRKIIYKFYRQLPAIEKEGRDEIVAWSSDHLQMLTGLLDDLIKIVKPKYFDLLPKNSDGSVRMYAFLESYLEKNHYRLRPAELRKCIELFQKEDAFRINELWFVSTGLKLILFHRFAQIADRVIANQIRSIKVSELKNVILSFLSYRKVDWRIFFEETSLVEKLLKQDPSGIYPLMDFNTRDDYRHAVEHLALQSGKGEVGITKEILTATASAPVEKKEKHIGYFLLGKNRKIIEHEIGYRYTVQEKISAILARTPGLIYYLSLLILTIVGILIVGSVIGSHLAYLLLLTAPITVAAADIINYLFTRSVKPKALSKMDFEKDIPIWASTMVVVPTQLGPNDDEPGKLLAQLESNYLNNQTNNLYFALLLAFRDSPEKKEVVTSEEESNLNKLKEGIAQLNQKYATGQPIFFVFIRPRIWNEKEYLSIEWERKRGKLIEFNRLLRGGATSFEQTNLDIEFLTSIKYIITLDQDDLLPKGAAGRLAATISHPLNQAKIDPNKKITSFGYGLIQPQLSCLKIKEPTLLEATFCGDGGWDSYSGVVSNVYQDVFGTGIFWGRGIYDIDIFNQILDHRFPENAILSHDQLEGFYARTGYASDIQIFEENPACYSSYVTRMTRWIRGDWQNIPWIFGRVKNEGGRKVANPISLSARYKLVENILRSIYLPSAFMAILLMIFLEKEFSPTIVYLSFGLILFQPLLVFLVTLLTQRLTLAWREYFAFWIDTTRNFILQVLFRILFWGHISYITVVAISKTLYRMLFSKKHLLQWKIFHHINRATDNNKLASTFKDFLPFELFFLVALILNIFLGNQNTFLIVFILLSMTAPIWAVVFSYNFYGPKKERVGAQWFNHLAIKTWRYFDETVSKDTNYLPPDRLQMQGRHPVSQMTSITNIGLYLLSLEVAYRFNYLCLNEYLQRSQELINTLKQMERFHGHFYNWYSIKHLKVMHPKYISTVDSGNLIASLMTAEVNFRTITEAELWSSRFWDALRESLTLTLKAMEHAGRKKLHPDIKKHREGVYRVFHTLPRESQNARHFYQDLTEIQGQLAKYLAPYANQGKLNNLRYWSCKSLSLTNDKLGEIELFYPWLKNDHTAKSQTLSECETQKTIANLSARIGHLLSSETVGPEVKKWLDKSQQATKNVNQESNKLSKKCQKIYKEIDLSFLYNKQQKLFYIGYNNTKKRYDRSHYDLLASESRLTSFVALALNHVPIEHWQALSRPIAASNGKLTLLSWGGSLFEYLFPQIFTESAPTSLITKSLHGAITDHIRFADTKKIPWGISESCFDLRNKEGDYQYALHGIPFLSLRPISKQDLVVSPYSSFLALDIFPKEAYGNLKRLEREGAEGKYGFYEAVDYNKPTALIFGGKPVQAFLSHHQSIILISIYNYLTDGGIRNSFSRHPAIKPLNFILNEKVTMPTNLRSAEGITQGIRQFQKASEANHVKVKTNFRRLPIVNLISNGKYRIYLNDRGEGFSQLENININPWHPDPTLRGNGNRIYIWDENKKKQFSPTPSFTSNDSLSQTVEYTEYETSFEEAGKEIATKLTTGLIDDEGLEYRVLTIKNLTSVTKRLKIAFGSEQILANGLEDLIHPSFNRLKTQVKQVEDFWLYSRRRMSDEANVYSGLKSLTLHPPVDSYVMTSRRDFVGRLPRGLPQAATSDQKTNITSDFDLIYGDITRLRLLPFTENKIVYLATASHNQQAVIELMEKYQRFHDFSISLREDKLNNEPRNDIDWTIGQKLLSLLLYRRPVYQNDQPQESGEIIGLAELRNRIGANSDNPILTTRIDGKTSKTAFRQLALYAQTLAEKGFGLNLVVITVDDDGYFQSNLDFVEKLLIEDDPQLIPSPLFQNLIIIKESDRPQKEIESLKCLSTLYVDLASGSLKDQIESEYKKL
jgi:cyclic beta-1,2-glucan synthetase